MNYQDFVLQLDRAPEERGFVARVLRSPAGEAEAPFVNPVSPAELDNLWQAAHDARQAHRYQATRDLGLGSPSSTIDPVAAELSYEGLGDRLYKALFRGPVRSCWARSLDEATRAPEGGLRLKLQLNLMDPDVAPLAELPWEYLFSQEQGGFLGLQRQTPILRHMRLPLPTGKALATQMLRVLIVSSQPGSMTPLSLKDECARIADTLSRLAGVETLSLENPTVEALREILLEKDFHVLHFMGHGGFDRGSGQGVLYFSDGNGAPVAVGGSLLASHLAGLHSLRLAFINACDTARSNSRAPFAGVSSALLRAGLPAVVAMQRPIPDQAALEFSRVVYRRLSVGDPIDAAVTEGRLAIARGRGALLEWGTPVLFSRADDGRIFTPEVVPVPSETLATIPSEALPQALTNRSKRSSFLLLLAGILATGAGITLPRWLARVEPAPIATTSPVGKGLEASAAHREPTPAPPPKEETPAPPKPASKPKTAAPAPEPQEISADKPSVPAPTVRSSYELSEGNPVSIPGVADVGARFFEREGRAFARFWVAPEGQGVLENPPVMAPGTIDFTGQAGTYHLDVLSLDLAGKHATIRLRVQP